MSRRVVLVVFDGCQPLDVVGPHEVFTGANGVLRRRAYEPVVVAAVPGTVRTESGLGLLADVGLGSFAASRRVVDTLVVAGGDGVQAACSEPATVAAVGRIARRARRVASVCSGAFLLAEAGLLNGRRVTTHWARARQLQRAYPALTVDPDPIFVRDGDVWTSAGVTAGIDLALALVEDDHGPAVARTVAQWLVVFLRRPGGQRQFAVPTAAAVSTRDGIADVVAYIAAHPTDDLSVAALATRAAMSERHFVRTFTAETGRPPGRHVEEVRLEVARRHLEVGITVEAAADAAGFGTAETMRRVFVRRLGVAPRDYRARFVRRGA